MLVGFSFLDDGIEKFFPYDMNFIHGHGRMWKLKTNKGT